MILYNGSNDTIEEIDLSKSRSGKGFGRGFYLSSDKQREYEMAERKQGGFLGGEPIVTAFEFDDKVITSGILKVKTFTATSMYVCSSLASQTSPKEPLPFSDSSRYRDWIISPFSSFI